MPFSATVIQYLNIASDGYQIRATAFRSVGPHGCPSVAAAAKGAGQQRSDSQTRAILVG